MTDTGRNDVGASPSPSGGPQSLDDAWLVIPLYNEAPVVRGVIEQARRVFPHVVVVDDGSRDASACEAAAAGAVVIQHPVNLGQGAALQTGFAYVLERTGARWVVTFDADGQHSVEDAAAMVERSRREDLGFVLGSRFLDGSTQVGWVKRLVLRTAAAVSSRSSGMHLTDAHNGLRVIRRDALERVQLRQNRMAHASEIVRQLGATGLAWAEHPVHITYTDYSRAKGQSLWNSVNILVDLVFS
ncbi:glycosyltransferase family 2 protein [Actinomyces sp. W5033]|uniref:glycosyltransferase family 2 protein n=1 Tax=Actinomyces sp. W5033 TaxID=3446479 RepID=UPI003EE007DE